MHLSHAFTIDDQIFWLSPERCMFWEQQKALIVADLHAGKTGHFRKSGIAIPQRVFREDLQRLLAQVLYFKAEQLILLGDFAHSHKNSELDLFTRWRNDFSSLHITLIKGNHDILHPDWYRQANMEIHDTELCVEHIRFCHDPGSPCVADDKTYHSFCGHLHPGVYLRGIAKQSLKFPCFYAQPDCMILPAFSKFTGLYLVRPKETEKIYAIVNQEIIQLQ